MSSIFVSLPLQWMPHIQVADVAARPAAGVCHGRRMNAIGVSFALVPC